MEMEIPFGEVLKGIFFGWRGRRVYIILKIFLKKINFLLRFRLFSRF